MTFKIDLHCHSTASDGTLPPRQLVERAAVHGLAVLSLTDHDTTAGLEEAKSAALPAGIRFIPGIELSTSWNNQCFHVVGLNISADYPPLLKGLELLSATRIARAGRIAEKLAKKGIPGALEAVMDLVGDGMITRTHFAEFLVSGHYAVSQQDAFDRYLAKGKPAYVSTDWTPLDRAVDWISCAGGIAVLAHPMRYKLTAARMKRFLESFKSFGGQAIEVVSGRNNTDEVRIASNYAQRFDLYGSVGSDFHSPGNPWVELGRLETLPSGIKPVWELF
ncbi:MAG: PHP domain-containing protein [Gammaproteobacteria bacterium]